MIKYVVKLLIVVIWLSRPSFGFEFEYTVKDIKATSPFVFKLEQPVPGLGGGLFVHDLNGDGLFDFVVTSDNHIGAYDHNGNKLWVKKVGIKLWDYLHHPSAIAGDMDMDGKEEIGYLADKEIIIIDAATGAEEKKLPCGKAEAMAIANLRGKGDTEVILQYSQTLIKAIRLDDGGQLWQSDEFRGIEHSPLRLADLDGDGLDEVAGASIIDDDGRKMNSWDLQGVYIAVDSIVIADIVPGYPLEVALAEQRGGDSHTDVVNSEKIVFRSLNPWNWEDPDKLAVGDFDSSRVGLEIFNRSSGGDGSCPRGKQEPFEDEECPWVIDSAGKPIRKPGLIIQPGLVYAQSQSSPGFWCNRKN